MRNSILKAFFITFGSVVLISCGNALPALPDDPNNEPAAIDGGHTDLGSETEPSLPEAPPLVSVPEPEPEPTLTEREEILKEYDYVDPTRLVPDRHLEEALIYYHKNKATFKNQSVLSIIDFSQKSTQKRWYFINMQTGSVWNIHVAHGKGSDSNHDGFAETFSNVSGSNASSLGFYRTAETYNGSNGFSLRLDGLSTTNSRARERAIVVHGASYVQDTSVVQGRSWGCPAVSVAYTQKVINLIKGGSLIYAAK